MIINGDCLQEMRNFPDNHFNCVLTDPPYGLQFMGKKWDSQVPGKEYWEKLLRICKPGTIALIFGGTRTYHRLACAIEDAGWEIRDCLQWLYGSGFPKSHNHFGFEGYGTALKPAYEPILLAMKPLDGTFAQNAEKWGVAGIDIDESRIPTNELKPYSPGLHKSSPSSFNDDSWKGKDEKKEAPIGRWPANVILDEEAAKQLDKMTKNTKSSSNIRNNKQSIFNKFNEHSTKAICDSGGASRFFYCAKASSSERNKGLNGMELKQTMGGGELNNTEDDVCGKYGSIKALQQNHHPTVKPIKLMEYLLKLIAPPKDALVLDPFLGSGTTLVAAKNLGINAVGIELSEEYCEIAKRRVHHVETNLFNYEVKEQTA